MPILDIYFYFMNPTLVRTPTRGYQILNNASPQLVLSGFFPAEIPFGLKALIIRSISNRMNIFYPKINSPDCLEILSTSKFWFSIWINQSHFQYHLIVSSFFGNNLYIPLFLDNERWRILF